MSERPTPETDNVAQPSSLLQYETVDANFARKLERERDEAREELADWENAALHVESDHPDEVHCGCVPILRKLLADARKERDEAREALRQIWQSGDAFLPHVDQETINRWRKAAGWEETK